MALQGALRGVSVGVLGFLTSLDFFPSSVAARCASRTRPRAAPLGECEPHSGARGPWKAQRATTEDGKKTSEVRKAKGPKPRTAHFPRAESEGYLARERQGVRGRVFSLSCLDPPFSGFI